MSDIIRDKIFDGYYNGRRFTPTPNNILHYLDIYEKDKLVKKQLTAPINGRRAAAGASALGTALMFVPGALKFGIALLVPDLLYDLYDHHKETSVGSTADLFFDVAKNGILYKPTDGGRVKIKGVYPLAAIGAIKDGYYAFTGNDIFNPLLNEIEVTYGPTIKNATKVTVDGQSVPNGRPLYYEGKPLTPDYMKEIFGESKTKLVKKGDKMYIQRIK